MTDRELLSSTTIRSHAHSIGRDLLGEGGEGGDAQRRFAAVWSDILHEFRNHLTALMAAATELRAEIPPALAPHVGAALAETERTVQSLTSLLAVVEASIRTVDPVIADLDGVVERAIRLAAPVVGRRVSITAKLGRKTGVKNRGAALESLLAALVIDLASPTESCGIEGTWAHEAQQVSIHAELGRSGLTIEVSSNGARPAPGSWRFMLARELAERLDATLVASPDGAAFAVQFR